MEEEVQTRLFDGVSFTIIPSEDIEAEEEQQVHERAQKVTRLTE